MNLQPSACKAVALPIGATPPYSSSLRSPAAHARQEDVRRYDFRLGGVTPFPRDGLGASLVRDVDERQAQA